MEGQKHNCIQTSHLSPTMWWKHLSSRYNQSFPKWNLSGSSRKIDTSTGWKPPKGRTFKVNVDGAFIPGETVESIAWVCRDSTGRLLNSDAKSVAASSSLVVEACALVEALNCVLSPQNTWSTLPDTFRHACPRHVEFMGRVCECKGRDNR